MIPAPANRTWSLSGRLGWRLAAVMLAAILLAAAAVAWRTIATVQELDDSALQNQARLIAAQLPAIPDSVGRITLPEKLMAPFRASDGDNVFMVYNRDQLVAASDPRAVALLAPVLSQRLRSGFFRVPTRSVDLHAVAVETIASLAPLALRNGVDLALLEGQAVPPVRGNYAALVLALTNLIENALSYAPAGSAVEIAITPPATIAVLDRGPGVPVEYRERIFERFQRGPAPCDGGAGLGLAIAAEIAAAHGGFVRAAGRAGGGATFVLRLGQRRLAAGDHGDDQVLPVQHAGTEHARQMAADEPEQHSG